MRRLQKSNGPNGRESKGEQMKGVVCTTLVFCLFVPLAMFPFWSSKPPRPFVANPKITLPSIEECESATYDNSNPDLDEALTLETRRDGEELIGSVSRASKLGAYTSWSFKLVVGEKVPCDSELSTGDVVLTLTEEGTKEKVTLDKAGEYSFDYEISVTTGDVDSDQIQSFIVRFRVKPGVLQRHKRNLWWNRGDLN